MRRAALISLVAALLAAQPGSALGAPKPRLGHTVVVQPKSGRVGVRLPGRNWMRLREKKAIPLSSEVNTTHGKVKLVSARSARRTQTGTFSGGRFKVTQHSNGLTDLTLTGGTFSTCRRATAASAASPRVTAAASTRRRLFGRAHGRFRTRGRNSSATVRGTDWLTEDRCTGTVTKNRSDDPNSKVVSSTRDLQFDLKPGQTATAYCNRFDLEPDTYCVMLLAQPADGLIGAGIITLVQRTEYALCVLQPNGTQGCYRFPLSEPDEQGFRLSAVVCPVGAPGKYFVGWSFDYAEDHVNLLYPYSLNLVLDVAGPPVPCQTEPPVPAA